MVHGFLLSPDAGKDAIRHHHAILLSAPPFRYLIQNRRREAQQLTLPACRGHKLLSYLEMEAGRLLGGSQAQSPKNLDKIFSKLRRQDRPAQVPCTYA